MKKFILPLAAGFALGLCGAAMAGNPSPDHGKVAARDHSAAVAAASGPQLLTDSQMDQVVAGATGVEGQVLKICTAIAGTPASETYIGSTLDCN